MAAGHSSRISCSSQKRKRGTLLTGRRRDTQLAKRATTSCLATLCWLHGATVKASYTRAYLLSALAWTGCAAMVATASAQKRRSAAVERPDLLEAEQGTHGQERCQHVVNAKRRKGELASPSSACTAATPSASGVPSERHAAQAAHRESGPAGPGMCAAALPSTSGRQADAAVRGKPRRTHEIDALFSAKQRSPAKVSPPVSSPC